MRVDLREGGEFPDKWLSWGKIIPLPAISSRAKAPIRRYFRLKLPSYEFGPDYWTDGGFCWKQRVLLKTSTDGMPDLSFDGWCMALFNVC